MRIKSGFELRDVCGAHLVVAYGEESDVNEGRVLTLDEAGSLVWRAVEGLDFTVDVAADILCGQYELEWEDAVRMVNDMIDSWTNAGLIE